MRVLQSGAVRLLDDVDASAVWDLLGRDPVGNVVTAARLRAPSWEPRRLGAQLWGYFGADGLESLCYAGANLIPTPASAPAVAAFARQAIGQARMCSSIFGREEVVAPLWHHLQSAWAPAREVRAGQALLATAHPPAVAADPAVRRVQPAEVDTLMPACVAMYSEELGLSPLGRDGGAAYRSRVVELVRAGHSFARIEDGQVLFKAEVGAVTASACQVQGVWVTPRLRGLGLGTAGMATVVGEALRGIAPVVSLYVNAHNAAARQAYSRVGFSPAGTFMSVLF